MSSTTRSERKTALVTGASWGIGYALSHELAKRGFDTVLVARNADRLQEVALELHTQYRILATVLPMDLGAPGAPGNILKEIESRKVHIDILVNNAGFGQLGVFAESDWATQESMLQVNILALVELTRHILPGMIAIKSGRILNLGSTASFTPVPNMAIYAATKAFVLSFSEALAAELEGTGVTVTALCPGVTESKFATRAKTESTRLVRLNSMSAESVARIGIAALLKGKRRVVPGVFNTFLIASLRFSHRDSVLWLGKRLMRP